MNPYKYDEVRFWSKKERISNSELENMYEVMINDFIENDKKVLDFGCGKGRTFKLYDGKKVTGFDITEFHKENFVTSNMESFDFVLGDGSNKLPFKDNEFDSVVCLVVLLHIQPKKVANLMKELARVGKKVFVGTYHSKKKVALAPHCFNHNYKKLLKDNDLRLIDKFEVLTTLVFDYEKK